MEDRPSEEQWEQERDRVVRAHGERPGDLASVAGLDLAGPLARELTALTRTLLAATTVHEVLERVIDAARVIIPSAHVASVTMRNSDGTFHTPVQSDPTAIGLDRVQYDARRGPCADSADPDGPALAASDDLSAEARWPEFGAACVQAGYHSVLATTLIPDPGPERLPGALNLWSRPRCGFVPADRDRALLLASHATLALATTSAVSASALERSQLRTAIASRDVIGQAKGILMARRGLDAGEAFDVLRRTSQDINVKVTDLAATLAASPHALDER